MFDDQTRTAYGCTDNTPILRTMPAGWKKVNSTLLRMREYETQNSKLATSSSIYQFLLAEKIQPPKIDVQDTKMLKTTRCNTLGGWTRQFIWLHTHDLLLTGERKTRCKVGTSNTCEHCSKVDDRTQFLHCINIKPAVEKMTEWLTKVLELPMTLENIMQLDYRVKDRRKKSSCCLHGSYFMHQA